MSGGSGGDGAGTGWRGMMYRAATNYTGQSQEQTREPGTRRKKIAGMLQSYYQGYSDRSSEMGEQNWPEVGTVRSENEELVLFPSYARLLPPKSPQQIYSLQQEGDMAEEDKRRSFLMVDEEQMEEEAVVEVDVRGWLYAPHSGPLSRKNRYAMWVARQLCGLPAQGPAQDPNDNPTTAEAAEAQKMASEIAGSDAQLRRSTSSLDGSAVSTNPSNGARPMSQAEINAAHSAFSTRMAPFTHRPIASAPINIFFYDERESRSRSLLTSDNGHFSLRARLPFVPTHVRVLITETLSVTEEIILHAPDGISLISDIDDTVKHSAISMGTREVFRNTFTAPLTSLEVPGVAKWYTRLHNHPFNVNIHYISNSPWQLFPVLRGFFQETGLPPGSFNLKQYSGMLQGIFEPAAERKKGTVERVITDFPHRKWILVGDSGEADLEVYTDIAEKYPRQILAIFIRDVTTPPDKNPPGFFDPNDKPSESEPDHTAEAPKVPPPLPKRKTDVAEVLFDQDLIDLNDDQPPLTRSTTASSSKSKSGKAPPPPPPKRKDLRSPPVPGKPAHLNDAPPEIPSNTRPGANDKPPPPPPPPRRSTTASLGAAPRPLAPRTNTTISVSDFNPTPPPRRSTNASLSSYNSSASVSPSPTPRPVSLGPEGVQMMSKKKELWRRRWAAAKWRCERSGVELKVWRTGADAEGECVRLVEEEMRRMREEV